MDMESSGAITLAGNLTFTAGVAVSCPTTLGGTIRAGPISISGATAGEVTSARFGTCSGGTIREGLFRERTPWTIKAESALGTLPDEATGLMLTIENVAFSGTFLGLTCLYGGTVRVLFPLTGNTYYELGAGRVVESRLRRVGEGRCPETGTLTGSLTLSHEGEEDRVYISSAAEILNDFTKARFSVIPPGHNFGTVGLSETIAFRFELELRTALRVTATRLTNSTDFTMTGVNVSEVLPAANYPMTTTLRTRGLPRRTYVSDYILSFEDRGGNTYTYIFISVGNT